MMRCKKMLIWVLLSAVLLPVEQVVAQGPPPHRRDRPMPPEERERIRENIETLRVWKLLEALDLSSELSMEFLLALKESKPLWIGNCNYDEVVDIGDVIYLINYLFINGPPPGDC